MEERAKRDQFAEFHRANPHVWQLWLRFAIEAIEAGHKVLSGQLVIERIRWETSIVTKSDDPYKINNNHKAYYARKFNDQFPHLPKFRTRELTSV